MKDQAGPPLILVDGSSYLYRAFHALPALTNSKGQPTGAVYGVLTMLKRLLTDYHPTHLAVVFDAKGKTFREELYPAYKATRSAMPAELVQQIEPLHHLIQAMGLPLIMIEGVEADDVIGTLAQQASKAHLHTIISTSDKDLAQLVNTNITLVNTMNNTTLDTQGVVEKFGVTPERIIDYLALVGDTSDNVPGVPQVGPKTAVKWLAHYGSLDNIIAHATEITGKVGEKLRTHLETLPLTKILVTIKQDVPLPLTLSELQIKSPNQQTLINLYKEMEFKNALAELLNQSPEIKKENSTHYDLIMTEKALDELITALTSADLIAFDTETTSLDYMQAKLVGISFAKETGKAAYIPFGHDYTNAPVQLKKALVLDKLKPLFENKTIKKIGQNSKYDIEVLAHHGIDVQGVEFDTMIESYILDSTSNRHDMDSLALKYLGLRTMTFAEVAGKGTKQLTFNQVDLEKASIYAAEDADITFRLHQVLWPKLNKEPGLKNVFETIEMPLVNVLATIERNGVLIDPNQLIAQGKELQTRLDEIEKQIYLLAGMTFNINSPKQLQALLFEQLKLPILQKTPTGQASTADPVLQELALEFELPKLIIEYRSLSKLISTYTNRLVSQINPETKRIHTSYNQTGTATGRLSSSEPNLQNIPIRTEEGRKIRRAFIAKNNHKIVSADYSQIELRIMAHMSADPALLQAFAKNLDIHKATAAEVWGVSLDEVTATMRRDAKAINFGLIYGMSAYGLTRQLGIDRKAAEEYIERYFARYPHVKKYMDNTREKAKNLGYVETLWGRRLYLPDIRASNIHRQKAAERTAINAPLQGSAADIIKLAMIHIDTWLREETIPAKMIMQVHDELVFEVAETAVNQLVAGIKERMSQAASLQVPLLVAVGIGDNWDAASAH